MRRQLSYANVMATVAVFIALGGTSYAAIKITGQNVRNGSLTGADVKNRSLTGTDVRDDSLMAADFKAGQLPQGPKGETGLQGLKGDRGLRGEPGQDGAAGAPEAWQALPYSATYGPFAADFHTGSLRKDQLGRVELRGLVARNGAAAPAVGDLIGTLPTGYRPSNRLVFEVAVGQPNGLAGRVDVLANGELRWMGASGVVVDADYISLSGVSFWTD
jgi:hypothetical protein